MNESAGGGIYWTLVVSGDESFQEFESKMVLHIA
jgi:hypothetical protein